MNTFTHTTMNKLATIIFTVLLTVFTFILSGCNTQEGPYVPKEETATPLGCLKSQGRYFDPKLKECVKVTSQEQAVILDAYREINRVMAEGKIKEGEYDIEFDTYISTKEAETLWAELKGKGAKMLLVSGLMPDGSHYDMGSPSPPTPTPKIWGKDFSGGAGCGWHHSFDDMPQENTLTAMMLKNIEKQEANPAYGKPHRPEQRQGILDGDCRIYSMNVMIAPEAIKEFWDNHLDLIRAVQPRINFLDKAMHPRLLGPTLPYTQE
jgi:hypothetical protein